MPTKIKPDFQPSQRVYELLKAYGIPNPQEFVGHEMGAFFLYFEETGKAKTCWNTTCLNWMKRTYEDKKHNAARYRVMDNAPGNPFEKALKGVQAGNAFDKMFDKPVEQIERIQQQIKPKPKLPKEERCRLADQYLAGLKI